MKAAVICFACLSTCFSLQAQEKVYFPFFEIINVHPQYQYSTAKLLKTYVEAHGKYELVIPSATDTLQARLSTDQVQTRARAAGAVYYLIGEMNALQDIMITTVSLYQTSDGQKLWTDILKAGSVDDLDPILQLLGQAIGTNKKASEIDNIYAVSRYSATALTKQNSNTSFGIGVGGLYTFYPGVDNNFSGGFGLKISYDSRDLIFDISGDLYFSDIDIYSLNLNVLRPFSKKDVTPFIGAGLGFGGHNIDLQDSDTYSTTKGGLLAYGHAGYLFNRTSNVQMRASLTAYTATYSIESQIPYGFGFNLTFTF